MTTHIIIDRKKLAERRAQRAEAAAADNATPEQEPCELDHAPGPYVSMPDAEFEVLAQEARDALRNAEVADQETEGKARKARADFAAAPSEKLALARAVADQHAANAHEALKAAKHTAAPVLAEVAHRAHLRRMADLEAQRDEERAKLMACVERVGRVFSDFRSSLGAEIDVALRLMNDNRHTCTELGNHRDAWHLEHLNRVIKQHLEAIHGSNNSHDSRGSVLGIFGPGSANAHVVIPVTFPLELHR